MNTTSIALFAAMIGAGGAVAGQLIAAIFTARREARRLDWERQRARAIDKAAVDEKFLELKRDAFSRFLSIASSLKENLMSHWVWTDIVVTEDVDDGSIWQMPKHQFQKWARGDIEKAAAIISEISLIAPSVELPARQLLEAALRWSAEFLAQTEPSDTSALERNSQQFDQLLTECRSAMHKSLGVGVS